MKFFFIFFFDKVHYEVRIGKVHHEGHFGKVHYGARIGKVHYGARITGTYDNYNFFYRCIYSIVDGP